MSDLRKYITERLARTSIGQALQKLERIVGNNRPLIIVSFIVSAVIGWKASTILLRPWTSIQLLVFLILTVFVEIVIIRITLSMYKPYAIETEEGRRMNVADTGEKGTSRFMNRDEAETAFTIKNIHRQTNNIIGADRNSGFRELYAIKEQYGINGNSLYIGSPGSGKTRCLGVPSIFQTIRRGESMVITDPKGELYMYTAKMAMAHGYTVKILNLDPVEMLHSDSFNYMSIIGEDDMKAAVFANTIIENTSDGTEDQHWKSQALNLLKCLVLVISTYHEELGVAKRLSSIYKLITTYGLKDFEAILEATIKTGHPAMSFFKAFQNGEARVKDSVYGSMGVRLSIFSNPIVQEITGVDDIDITLPGREKCIYYISMSDQEHSMNFLVALFFSLYFQENVALANSLPEKKLPVKTWLLLDEFFSIGAIPDFPQKLSNIRSRGINCTIIVQDITQLQQMYPDNLWQTVVNCCSSVILLQTGAAPETAKFFSDRSGDMTVVEQSIRYGDSPFNLVKDLNGMMTSEVRSARKVLTPDEVQTMSPQDELVVIATKHVIKLKKYDFLNHPMVKEIKETLASNHLPQWYLSLSDTEKIQKGIPIIQGGELLSGEGVDLCSVEDFKNPVSGEEQKERAKNLISFLTENIPFELSTEEDTEAWEDEYDEYDEEEPDEIDEGGGELYQEGERESDVLDVTDDVRYSASSFRL